MEENDKERVVDQLNHLSKIIEQENNLFLNIGSFVIALIIILSLGKELIFLNIIESKILLTIFLSLNIIILGIHQYSLNLGKKKSMSIIEEIMDKKVFDDLEKMDIFHKIISYAPKIIAVVFFICISYIIYAVWR